MKRIALTILIYILQLVTPINASTAALGDLERSESSVRIFYVAPNGNDQWTGALPIADLSRKDGPFATLEQARNAIRELKEEGSKDSFTVLVRGGIYQLNETFTLGPQDSGTESRPLVFKAFDNEHPVLCGTRKISNFKPYKGQILKADLEGTGLEVYNVRQLFADGKRQVLARFPNFSPLNPIGGGFLYVGNSTGEESKQAFKYQDESIHEWSNPQDAEVVIYPGPNYWNNILPVRKIDGNDHLITLSSNASYAIKPGNRYYYQNILEELDSPGEWYFDRRKKVLYFWPPNEASLQSVSFPILESIVEIKGSEESGSPTDIRFEGFTLEGCNGSAVVVNGAKRTAIARCTIFNAGGKGIEVQDGSENSIVGNDVYEVGGTGIYISGGDRKSLTPASHRIDNNYIHDIGILRKISSGIDCRGVGNIVSHNLIHSTPRIGISFDGNDHLIEYNHVHHVNQETQDSGIIYSCARDWTKQGNVVQFNYVHDSGGYGWNKAEGAWRSPFYTWGIYLDDWSSGTKVYGNIVADTVNGGIFIHGGRDNIVENNVIIEGGSAQMVYSGIPISPEKRSVLYRKIQEMGYTKYSLLSAIKDTEKSAAMSGNSFLRNIIYYVDNKSALYNIHNDIDLATTISNYNIIHHSGSPILIPFTKASAEQQWITWQAMGLDQHSIIADPLFFDIVRGDFHLSPNSPALKLGFKPIPFEKIGPYEDPLRASWPLQ
jgi:parallel beta-helix repeat protein